MNSDLLSEMEAIQPITVLVADDCEENQFLWNEYCRGTLYHLTFVQDGKEAVDAFQTGHFHAVIMDLQMPVMDGFLATRMIRRLESDNSGKHTPIYAVSGHTRMTDVQRALAAGCDSHLAKPISKSDFLSALRRATSM